MLCFPNCKINLGLYLTCKREDGYHDLETVFYPLAVQDILEIIPAEEGHLHLSGLEVAGKGDDNLVLKAYNLLDGAFPGKVPRLDIFLHKMIPMGAGLGGGSADGAFMLRLVNDYCKLGLDTETLAAFALQLGSDCPFFIYNTSQYATGRGEKMTGINLDLSKYSILLICPEVHVSTGKAFGMITPMPAKYDLRRLSELPVNQWKTHISNDFEPPVFGQHPVLAAIKRQLYDKGAVYASMSGSGSAIYGIFRKKERATVDMDIPAKVFYIP